MLVSLVRLVRNTTQSCSLLVALCVFSPSSQSIVFEVTSAGELRAALTAAGSNAGDDEIRLAPGIYEGSFKYFAEENFSIAIIGGDGDEPTVIDASGNVFGLLLEGNDRPITVRVEYLTITNATNGGRGGGMIARSIDGSIALRNMEFAQNTAAEGSGIFLQNVRDLKLQDSQFVENHGTGQNRHAAYILDVSKANLARNRFIDNEGGDFLFERNNRGVYGDATNRLEIQNSFFSNQLAPYRSFGIHTTWARNLFPELGTIISGNVFSYLPTAGSPIDIRVSNESLTIAGNYFSVSQNATCRSFLSVELFPNPFADLNSKPTNHLAISANKFRILRETEGGSGTGYACDALQVGNGGRGKNSIRLSDNLFIGASFLLYGEENFDTVGLVNNTFADFETTVQLNFLNAPLVTVANNIFESSAVDLDLEVLGTPLTSSLANNILTAARGYWDVEENNLILAAGFSDPEGGDYHLVADSPAVDAGDNRYVEGELPTDVEGNPRITDGVVDIGALERSTEGLHPADINGDQTISQTEFDNYNAAWRTNQLWTVAPEVIPVDFVTRAGFLLQNGGTYKNIGVGKPQTWVPLSD